MNAAIHPCEVKPVQLNISCIMTDSTVAEALKCDHDGLGPVSQVENFPGCSVRTVRTPEIDDVLACLQQFSANLLYMNGSLPQNIVADSVGNIMLKGERAHLLLLKFLSKMAPQFHCIYFDAANCAPMAKVLYSSGTGTANVIFWEQEPKPLVSMCFSYSFFAFITIAIVSVPEAFAFATSITQVYTRKDIEGLPRLLAHTQPELPTFSSLPPIEVGGVLLRDGSVATAVPGYSGLRLLAPQAEMRMLMGGLSDLINDKKQLSLICDVLRGLIVAEVRVATMVTSVPCVQTPAHLPAGSAGMKCRIQSASGAMFSVVLGGPPEILENTQLTQHALRQTLVADAGTLQFKLPPEGEAPPKHRTIAGTAGGAPTVETLVAISTWCIHLLKHLARDCNYRPLAAMGIAAVGDTPVAGFTQDHGIRYSALLGLPSN